MKVMKKTAVKKMAVKAKSPAKQYIDPNDKKREQDRQSKMTEEQKTRERKEGRPSDNPRPDRLRVQVEKEREAREAKRRAEKGKGAAMSGKKEGPAGPMQLKSSAKTAPAKMKKC
jgi:hypothetical protein